MLSKACSTALLIIRLALGIIFIAHGAQKLFGAFGGGGIAGTAPFLGQLGFHPPVFWAWMITIAEFFGGLGVLFGLLARIGAAGILIGQLVAVATVHVKHGFFLQNGGFEYNLTLIAIALAIIIVGPGNYSLDKVFRVPKML